MARRLTQADSSVSIARNSIVPIVPRIPERAQRLGRSEPSVESLSISSVGVDEGGTGVNDASSGTDDLFPVDGSGVLGDCPVGLLGYGGVGDRARVFGRVGTAQVELGAGLREGEGEDGRVDGSLVDQGGEERVGVRSSDTGVSHPDQSIEGGSGSGRDAGSVPDSLVTSRYPGDVDRVGVDGPAGHGSVTVGDLKVSVLVTSGGGGRGVVLVSGAAVAVGTGDPDVG